MSPPLGGTGLARVREDPHATRRGQAWEQGRPVDGSGDVGQVDPAHARDVLDGIRDVQPPAAALQVDDRAGAAAPHDLSAHGGDERRRTHAT